MKRKHIRIKKVDTFTTVPYYGSPAGVVTEANDISEEEMQKIAREMNVSQTVFTLKPEAAEAGCRLRFFTPQKEVDLSGHATVAAFHSMVEEGKIWPGKQKTTVIMETRAGLMPVDLFFENGKLPRVMITLAQPQFKDADLKPDEIARVLDINPGSILATGLPAELVYIGVWHLIIPLERLETFGKLKPDFDRLEALNRDLGVLSTHLFSLETIEKESTVHTRNFAPAVGVRENPVSGAANGALGCYLVKNGVVEVPTGKALLVAEQGYEIERTGKVAIEVTMIKEQVTAVRIGGTAVTVLDGIIRL